MPHRRHESSHQGNFDRFTERARRCLTLAQEEAQRLGQYYIGTEHLLLGLLHDEAATSMRALRLMGVEPGVVRQAVQSRLKRPDVASAEEIGLTWEAKRVIELAVDEAQRLDHHYIGTGHLLLGLIREGDGIGAQALASIGVNLEKARPAVIGVTAQSESTFHTTLTEAGTVVGVGHRPDETDVPPGGRSFEEDRNRLIEPAQQTLELAREEARRFHHNYIGTEHLLLGLLRQQETLACDVLSRLGVELAKVRSAVEFIIGRGSHPVSAEIVLTPRAKRVVWLAVQEARRLGEDMAGTEHLLLGLIREGEGIAAGVLESLGVNLDKARGEVLAMLGRELQGQPLDPPRVAAGPARPPTPQPPGAARVAFEYVVVRTEERGEEISIIGIDGPEHWPRTSEQPPVRYLALRSLIGQTLPVSYALATLGEGGWQLAAVDRIPVASDEVSRVLYICFRPKAG